MRVDISRLQGLQAPKALSVNGVQYGLYKSIEDPSVPFNYNNLIWINTGCEKISDTPELFYCWIRGIIPPTPNTMEKPMDIMLLGLNRQLINMNPQFLTMDHMKNMFIYKAEPSNFVEQFLYQFIGVQSIETQSPMLTLDDLNE